MHQLLGNLKNMSSERKEGESSCKGSPSLNAINVFRVFRVRFLR